MKRRNGLLHTGAIGFGTSDTTCAKRVPKPPANTIASMISPHQKVRFQRRHTGNDIPANGAPESDM